MVRSSRRYWASSAWQRRQLLDVVGLGRRRAAPGSSSAAAGSRSATCVTPHGRDSSPEAASRRNTSSRSLRRARCRRTLAAGLGDAQLGGDGLVGQVVDVAQHDHGPQPGREARAGRAAPGRAGRRARPGRRGRARAGGRRPGGRRASSSWRWRARRPRWVDGAVGGDAVQPGRELGVAPEPVAGPGRPAGRSPG